MMKKKKLLPLLLLLLLPVCRCAPPPSRPRASPSSPPTGAGEEREGAPLLQPPGPQHVIPVGPKSEFVLRCVRTSAALLFQIIKTKTTTKQIHIGWFFFPIGQVFRQEPPGMVPPGRRLLPQRGGTPLRQVGRRHNTSQISELNAPSPLPFLQDVREGRGVGRLSPAVVHLPPGGQPAPPPGHGGVHVQVRGVKHWNGLPGCPTGLFYMTFESTYPINNK